jgi:hypothetical protein
MISDPIFNDRMHKTVSWADQGSLTRVVEFDSSDRLLEKPSKIQQLKDKFAKISTMVKLQQQRYSL